MKTLVLLLCLATTASAQTRTVALQAVFVTYVQNRTHWTDPVVKGPQLIAQDNSFWSGARGSWGSLTLTGTTWPTWIESNQSMAGGCSLGTLTANVQAAMGLVPPNTIRLIVLPPGTPCNSQSTGLYTTGATSYTVTGSEIEHETGHGLGLTHARARQCTASGCSTQEYGPYSVMGSGTYSDAIGVIDRKRIGAYSPIFQIVSLNASQDVTLQFSNTMTPGVKGVIVPYVVKKIVMGPFGPYTQIIDHTMTVEFRSGDYLSMGVIVRGYPQTGYLQTMDYTQQNPWRLAVGKTYCDTPYICVTAVSQTATTATVHVAVEPNP